MSTKQMLKKITAVLIASAITVSMFAACANNEDAQENSTTTKSPNESVGEAGE